MSHTGDPLRLRERAPSNSLLGQGLEAARLDGPSDEQLRDLERKLTAGLLAVAVAAPVAKATSAVGGASWLSATATKAVLVTLSLATIGGGAFAVSHALAKKAIPQTRPVPADARRSQPAATVAPLPNPPDPPAIAGEKPSIPAVRPAARSAPAEKKRPVLAATPQADDETSLLDRANRALAHEPALALLLANEHRQHFADGPLAQERELIAIRALVRLGRHQDARERMAEFLRSFPRSVYRARVEQLMGEQ